MLSFKSCHHLANNFDAGRRYFVPGRRWRDCFSDEHYFATLLAVLGRENETDCKGFMMHVDWSRGGAHPRTYELREISAARCTLSQVSGESGLGYQWG